MGRVAIIGVLLCLVLAGTACQPPGEAPPSSGPGGKVVTPIGDEDDRGYRLLIQPDGKIVVAADSNSPDTSHDFAVVRYDSNGCLDATFGGDGIVTTAFGGDEVRYDSVNGIALQPDGKVVVAGGSAWGTDGEWAIVRYHSDGSLDSDFDGDGRVTTNLGCCIETAHHVALQADGKIVVSGELNDGESRDIGVVRYNDDGSLDSAFGTGGVVKDAVGHGHEIAWGDLLLQTDGKIVVSGYAALSTQDVFVVRYDSAGNLDRTFGGDGKAVVDLGGDEYVAAAALQGDGKIVVAGFDGDDVIMLRFNADGSLDGTFGSDGHIRVDLGGGDDQARALALQSDGKIVAAGTTDSGPNHDFAVMRFSADGSLDTGFDDRGYVTVDFAGDDYARGVAIQDDGKIVVSGWAGDGTAFDLGVIRFNSDGSLDNSFGCATPPSSADIQPG